MSIEKDEFYEWERLHKLCGTSLNNRIMNYVKYLEKREVELTDMLRFLDNHGGLGLDTHKQIKELIKHNEDIK